MQKMVDKLHELIYTGIVADKEIMLLAVKKLVEIFELQHKKYICPDSSVGRAED